jgi:hypothetical protein
MMGQCGTDKSCAGHAAHPFGRLLQKTQGWGTLSRGGPSKNKRVGHPTRGQHQPHRTQPADESGAFKKHEA